MICALCGATAERDAEHCSACGRELLLDGRFRLDRPVDPWCGNDPDDACYRATRIEDGMLVRARRLDFRPRSGVELADFEARLAPLRELRHPAVPLWIEDFTRVEDRRSRMWTIHAWVRGAPLSGEVFEELAVLELLREAAGLLVPLHLVDIVHGAITPHSLVRRTSDRGLSLVDFGRPALLGPVQRPPKPEVLASTAPELLFGALTPAADVWGLGSSAIISLTGLCPTVLRVGGGRLQWREHVTVSEPFARLLDEMLDPDPKRRLPSATALVEALETMDQARRRRHSGAHRRQAAATRRMSKHELGSIQITDRPGGLPWRPAAETRSGIDAVGATASTLRSHLPLDPRSASGDVPVVRPDELSRELSRASAVVRIDTRRKRARVGALELAMVFGFTLLAAALTWLVATS